MVRPEIAERLDFVAKRISGLKVLKIDQSCILAYETYYVEVKLDKSMQLVTEVIVKHEAEENQKPCPVLKEVLAERDYETFAKHLSGLHSMYSIQTTDKKVRQKAYPTITALETDLDKLYRFIKERIKTSHDLVHKSPLGIMEPRKGGLPVRLTYFLSPYDMVDPARKSSMTLTENDIIDKNLGLSATVEIEGARMHKLQSSPLFSTRENTSLPQYEPFNETNSEKLPAQFVLKLSQPFPMLNTSIHQIINEIHEPSTIKDTLTAITTKSKDSLISLIARQELDLNKGPFCRSLVDSLKNNGDSCDPSRHVYVVKLLEQYHTYHILDNHLERQDGVYVTKIPFTHPASIPIILKILRQQALFNFVIGSCIRRNKNNPSSGSNSAASDMSNAHLNNNLLTSNTSATNTTDENATSEVTSDANIFDVIPVNLNSVCVSFEHPSRESLATLEIDFREYSCQLYALDKESVCSNEYATKVFQKCWSIPITLRSVLKKCNERRLALLEDANKRRERELQELLASNNTNPPQTGLQFKSQQQSTYPKTTILSSRFTSVSEKSNPRDLNSIAEYLSSKLNNNVANTNSTSTSSQASSATNNQEADSRSNLLKKFSCKPKAKQNNSTAKNQTGNKILSLMLKRQNSTPSSSDDSSLKATITKKARTKVTPETGPKTGLTMAKLISPEVANAARLASQAAKQQGSKQQNPSGQPNASLSLIRSPNKLQNQIVPPSSSNPVAVGVSLTPNPTINTNNVNSLNVKLKTQINGTSSVVINNNNNNNVTSKPRKSSIGAVIDRIVGGLTPSDQNAIANNQAANSMDSQQDSPRTSQAKSKTRAPGGDQFAIKQGSSGGLKLTVTKTKPAGSPLTPAPAAVATSSSQPSASNPIAATVTNSSTSAPSTSSSSSSSAATNQPTSSSTNASETQPAPKSSVLDANKLLGLSSSGPTIKYTIPKISKTSQSATSDNNTTSSGSDSNSQGDDATNPSSSANLTATASSSSTTTSTTKRVSATPFSRPNNPNRNPVSSSTHPLGRTTSNPLAGASNRPSSTSANKEGNSDANGAPNRISSTNQGQRQLLNSNRVGLQQQQKQQTGPRPLNPNLSQQPNQTPMFALGLNQPSPFANTTDINILAANQAALLNQQRTQQQQLQMQQSLGQAPNPLIPNLAPGQFLMTSSVDTSIISSSKPQFAAGLMGPSQPISTMPTTLNNLAPSSTSLAPNTQATPSVINAAPQFYVPATTTPMNSIVSSQQQAPRNTITVNEVTPQSSIPNISPIHLPQQQQQQSLISSLAGQPLLNFQPTVASSAQQQQPQPQSSASGSGQAKLTGVSSSSDNNKPAQVVADPASPAQDFSTPSSPTEATGQVNAVQPPPLIPIDSLEEPRATSPELPDDASDRLSIVDMNDNAADSLSAAGTPKPSSQIESPMSVGSAKMSPVANVGKRRFFAPFAQLDPDSGPMFSP